jgi:hypothetical protein
MPNRRHRGEEKERAEGAPEEVPLHKGCEYHVRCTLQILIMGHGGLQSCTPHAQLITHSSARRILPNTPAR